MTSRSDEVRASAAFATSVLLEHDYADYFRNNDDSNKNGDEIKGNVFGTNNKFHGTFDAVDKWADSVITRVPIGHDRRKIVDREITIHKVKYPFLPEQQIRGKVYRKFGIPTLMGGVLSRDVASLSGCSTKDHPKQRRNLKRANDRRGPATTSQNCRAVEELLLRRTSRSSPEKSPPVEEQLGGSRDHPQRPPMSERSDEVPMREETCPPTVSSYISAVSDGELFFGSEKSQSPSSEHEFLRVLELGEKSPDLEISSQKKSPDVEISSRKKSPDLEIPSRKKSPDFEISSSDTQQLISPLDLDRLSLDDKVALPDTFARRSNEKSRVAGPGTSESEARQFRNLETYAPLLSQESVHSQLTQILDREEQRVWGSAEADVALDRVSVSRVRSTRCSESLKTAANASLEDMPTRINASTSTTDHVRTNTVKNCPRDSSCGRREDFLRMSSATNGLDANEFLLLERVRSAGDAFVRKFDENPSSWDSSRMEERAKDQSKVKRSSSALLVGPSKLSSAAKKVHPERFVSRCSWTRRQPGVLHSRSSMPNKQPEVLDSRSSSTGEPSEVFGCRGATRGIVDLDHSYGVKVPKNTGSEPRHGGKRVRIESAETILSKIRKSESLESAGSITRMTGKFHSSENKENFTHVSYCVKLKKEKKIHGVYSPSDDILLSSSDVASAVNTIESKQARDSRPIATDGSANSRNAVKNVDASKFIGKPEVRSKFLKILSFADFPKNLNVSATDSSPTTFIPSCANSRLLLPVDLLSNHCCEYDHDFAINPSLCGNANEFRSRAKIGLEKNQRVSSSEMAKTVEKILQFLDKNCVDF